MRKFLIAGFALLLTAVSLSAQSAAEIAAAKSLARTYGYSNEEINAVLNHDINGRVSGPAQSRQTVTQVTIPNQALPGDVVAGVGMKWLDGITNSMDMSLINSGSW